MRQALWILRKDIRRMRPHIAVVWALMVLGAAADAAVGRYPTVANWSPLGLAIGLAMFLVAIAVVHEDRLVGDRQFWTTRPYSWKSLLLSKALFVLLILNLPQLLDSVVALLVNGLSPIEYLPQLLYKQLQLAAAMLLFVVLAALTTGIVQAVLAILAGFAALFAGIWFLSSIGVPNAFPRGCVSPVDGVCQWTVATLLFGLACWHQFSKRNTSTASVLFLCGLLSIVPSVYLMPWETAFRVVASRSPAVDPSAVRLAPDAARRGYPNSFRMEEGKLNISLPIQVSGIPQETLVYSERIKLVMRAPDGTIWDSGWDPYNEILDNTHATDTAHRALPGKGGPYWLSSNVDPTFYRTHSAEPVNIHATVAFTQLGRGNITPVNRWGKPQPIGANGVCVCELSNPESLFSTTCAFPLGKPVMLVVHLPPQAAGDTIDYAILVDQLTGFGIWHLFRYGALPTPRGPFAASIETRQPFAHFEREFDMAGVRLKELREP